MLMLKWLWYSLSSLWFAFVACLITIIVICSCMNIILIETLSWIGMQISIVSCCGQSFRDLNHVLCLVICYHQNCDEWSKHIFHTVNKCDYISHFQSDFFKFYVYLKKKKNRKMSKLWKFCKNSKINK